MCTLCLSWVFCVCGRCCVGFFSLRHNSHREGLQSCVPNCFFGLRSFSSFLLFRCHRSCFIHHKQKRRKKTAPFWLVHGVYIQNEQKMQANPPRNIKRLLRSSSLFLLVRSLPSHHHHRHRCLRSGKQLNNGYRNTCSGDPVPIAFCTQLFEDITPEGHPLLRDPLSRFRSLLLSRLRSLSLSLSVSLSLFFVFAYLLFIPRTMCLSHVRFRFHLSDSLFSFSLMVSVFFHLLGM
jgi:hypothetical protein